MSEDYRNPTTNISYRGAFSHRLRRVYLPLISGMLVGWLFHLWAFTPDEAFPASASLPGINGYLVTAVVAIYYVALLVLAIPLSRKERGEAGAADHGNLE